MQEFGSDVTSVEVLVSRHTDLETDARLHVERFEALAQQVVAFMTCTSCLLFLCTSYI